MAKNEANAKQDPEAELLPFENYSHASSTLSSINNRKCAKTKELKKRTSVSVFIRLYE